MIERELIEDRVKRIEQNTLKLKTAQPFYDGQLDVNLVESNNTYDYSLSGNFQQNIITGYVRFSNQSGKLPFCNIYTIVGDTPGGGLSISNILMRKKHRVQALYAQGGVVGYKFEYTISNVSSNTLYIKYYALTNDIGGNFQIYGNDWSTSW